MSFFIFKTKGDIYLMLFRLYYLKVGEQFFYVWYLFDYPSIGLPPQNVGLLYLPLELVLLFGLLDYILDFALLLLLLIFS